MAKQANPRLTWTRRAAGEYVAHGTDGQLWKITQTSSQRWVVSANGDEQAAWPTSLAEAKMAAEDAFGQGRELRGGYRRPVRRSRQRLWALDTQPYTEDVMQGNGVRPIDNAPNYAYGDDPWG